MSSKKDEVFSDYQVTSTGRVIVAKNAEIASDTDTLPSLTEIQTDSFKTFFQEGVKEENRRSIGLQYLFESIFPFTSNDNKVLLEFCGYTVEERPYSDREAVQNDRSYVIPVKATIRLILKETGEIREQEIFISEFPAMTDRGTFIINGDERVVVSQIHRSPGVVFDYNKRALMYHSRIIPDKGPWVEFEILKDIVYIRIDRKNRIPFTVFLRALGYEKNEDILSIFYTSETVKIDLKKPDKENLLDRILAKNVIDEEGNVVLEAGSYLQEVNLDEFVEKAINSVDLIKASDLEKDQVLLNTLWKEEKRFTQVEACEYFFYTIRGNRPSNAQVALNEITVRWGCKNSDCDHIINSFDEPDKTCEKCDKQDGFERVDKSIFFHPAYYSLSDVGRYKINKKFNYEEDKETSVITPRDVIETVKHLIKVKNGDVPFDDIDHLGNRRVRCVSEQLVNALKISFARVQKLAKDRMSVQDIAALTPQKVISIKPISNSLNEFFGTSQLSQFMDQTNPLSAITHKRRISALGIGGLTRERAGFEVRDIHYTHYGRICPIETPEGPNIGLIVSLGAYARINSFGFIETPYYRVEDGEVTNKVDYLSAIEEERFIITPASTEVKKNNKLKEEIVPIRSKGNYSLGYAKEVDYKDISSKQIVSISGSLIPFLEHNDANRALMGCNMMRQAVPLLKSAAPIVGTGMENVAARESGFCLLAKNDGVVTYADNSKIEVTTKNQIVDEYQLIKSKRTNQETYFNQSPIVKEGQKVKKGDMLTGGPSIDNSELALGKNILVAFMPWKGYNYEDAVLMSERLLKDDVYTSIHIEELDVEARETKMGKESITREVPNLSEDEYKELDDTGVVVVGARVKPGNILVGKVTPKGHTEITPEYRLLYSIFGEKAKDVKDTSLRVPHGTEGVVIHVKRYNRRDHSLDFKPGVIEKIKVFIAKKRKLKEGDKFAGRHGNKGVVARIMPEEDMPFMEDGTPVDVVLNALGVPSRMNIGQVMETILGLIGRNLNCKFSVPIFDAYNYDDLKKLFKKSGLDEDGKKNLYDGRSGERFKKKVTVGVMYYLKLAHLADDKVHARSTGPYSLITQQPLGGKAQFGGQRVGEMEVWAIEAYGASNVLQEFLTVKSDSIDGRTRVYEAIVKGNFVTTPGIPESFNVLVQELRGLGINIEMYNEENKVVEIFPVRNATGKISI